MNESDASPNESATGQSEAGEPTTGEPTLGQPIVVPHTQLRADLLRNVVESFVLREGTDYGEREVSLDNKVANVVRQLERGEAQIVFDPQSESIDIVVVKGRASG